MALNLNDNQIKEFTEVFQLFDSDGDGKIRPQDLGMVMRSLGQIPTEAELTKFINDIKQSDNNHSNDIEWYRTTVTTATKNNKIKLKSLSNHPNTLHHADSQSLIKIDFLNFLTIIARQLARNDNNDLTIEKIREAIDIFDNDADI